MAPADDLLKKLRRDPSNMHCPNCNTAAQRGIGFGHVCVKFKTFVCDMCKTSHQAISHRVKSISMSSWTLSEVKELLSDQNGGNETCRNTWLANAPVVGGKYKNDGAQFGYRPKEGDRVEVYKNFVMDAYDKKMFYGSPTNRNEQNKKSVPGSVSATEMKNVEVDLLGNNFDPFSSGSVDTRASTTSGFDFVSAPQATSHNSLNNDVFGKSTSTNYTNNESFGNFESVSSANLVSTTPVNNSNSTHFDLLDNSMSIPTPSNCGNVFDNFSSSKNNNNNNCSGGNNHNMNDMGPLQSSNAGIMNGASSTIITGAMNTNTNNISSMNAANSASVNISVMGSPRMMSNNNIAQNNIVSGLMHQQQDAFGNLGLPNFAAQTGENQLRQQQQQLMNPQHYHTNMISSDNHMTTSMNNVQINNQQQMNFFNQNHHSFTAPQGTMLMTGSNNMQSNMNNINGSSSFAAIQPKTSMIASAALSSPVSSAMNAFDTNNLSASLGQTLTSSGKYNPNLNSNQKNSNNKAKSNTDSFNFVNDLLK